MYDILKQHVAKKNSKKEIPVALWKKEQQNAFLNLKQALSAAVILTYPDPNAMTRLVTDASDGSVGADLEQHIQGNRKPISYYSQILPKPYFLCIIFDSNRSMKPFQISFVQVLLHHETSDLRANR